MPPGFVDNSEEKIILNMGNCVYIMVTDFITIKVSQ